MSFAGKFDGTLSDGQGSQPHGHGHVDSVSTHAPPGAIIVPDAHLLFTGDFKRSGVDLILSADDRKLVLHDYFKGEKHAALASPDGAHLTGDIVDALSGYTQFAQADGSASVAQVIGHVTKLTGTATVIRNGVSIILNQGDNVNKGDVVQSGSDSSLGITFIDGSVFGLASNAKMVLNEMIYDPNGSNNSSLISLVQGTISFVAGATAKHGDMKVDTPVATMGIRGTAVLVEIDFEVSVPGNAPPAKFQVLVEPDGTTGSYILFDKTTLTPIATVNLAGTQTIVNGQGTVSFLSSAQLSPDAQKIITDVFAQKFTDNTNPKDTTHFTDSITQESLTVKLANGDTVFVTAKVGSVQDNSTPPSNPTTPPKIEHIDGPPIAVAFNSAFTERDNATHTVTHSSQIDTLSDKINWVDINAGDLPSATAKFESFTYKDANNHDVTASLTAEQLAAIQAVEIPLTVVQDPGNNNNGSATWTYNIADSAFDFLAAGETLTLTYMARVDNNYAPNDEWTLTPITITITGTNDAPTIATSGGAITERLGTGNTAVDTASGTVTFTDVDLTDRPIVSAALSTDHPFRYLDAQGHDITDSLTAEQLAAIAAVEVPLTVVQAAGNTHNGSATWTYSIADKAFDFIAKGETLTLNYVAEVDDGHGGVVSTPITVSINGADISVTGTNDNPVVTTTSNAFAEQSNESQPNPTGSTALDTVSGTIGFTDVDLTDRPVASAAYTSFTYTDASGHALSLTEQQQADVAAVAVPLTVTQADGNTDNGSATWTYSLADGAFDFLAEGEILTLTYTATVDDGHGGVVTKPFTVTITGTNDTPTIATTSDAFVEQSNDSQPNPTGSAALDTVSGTISFTDVDLTDRPVVSASFTSFTYTDSSHNTLAPTELQQADIAAVEDALTVTQTPDNTDNGSATWTYSLADGAFDFLAAGEILTLTYTATVDDGHGGVISKPFTVTITGTNDTPVITSDTQAGAITELDGTLNASTPDQASGAVTFTDVDLTDAHAVTITGVSASGVTSGLADNTTVLGWLSLGALTDSTDGGTGARNWAFSAADKSFDYLAAGETLTLTYTIEVDDHHGGVVTQPVTITITGTNDAPDVAADVSGAAGLHAITEQPNTTDDSAHSDVASGSLAFADVDLSDTHNVDHSKPVFSWSDAEHNPLTLTSTQQDALTAASALALTLHDSTGTGAGSVDFSYSAADSSFDFLAAGETLTITYDVTVTDINHATSTRPVTITITGSNDAPVVAAALADNVNDDDAAFTRDLLDGASDADHGETATLHIAGVTYAVDGGAASGTAPAGVSLGADGHTLTVDPTDPAFDYLTAGEQTVIVVSYDVTDAQGATVPQTETVTISGIDDAPAPAASPTVTITVLTPDSVDFQSDAPLREMGAGTIQPVHSSTTFTIVDSGDNVSFVVDGSNFTYSSSGDVTSIAGGILTSFHEFTADGKTALADFTGLSVDAVTWMLDVQQAALGNKGPIDALTSTFAYTFTGGPGNDAFGSAGHADMLTGGAGNDTLDPGGAPSGSHDTVTGGAGADTFIYQQGYGALTITDFDQGNSPGVFDSNEADQIQLNGLTAPLSVSYANGNAILDFGNNDVVTLLNVTQSQYEALDGSEFTSGGNNGGSNNNGGGNNSGGPVISNADNTVTYTGTPVFLDPSITVTDATGTVTSVDAWFSSGFQSGDTLSIGGSLDGDLTNSDHSTIHYHFDGNAISLAETSGIVTLADFDAALQLIQFSPGAADGARTVTWAAHEAVNTSPTVTTTIDVGPILNSFALTVGESDTGLLSNSDFNVSDPGFTDLTYTVNNVTGGHFEVRQGGWAPAPTGGFTTAQIAAGDVKFVQDDADTVPDFLVHVSDGSNASPDIAAMVTLEIAGANSETITFAGSSGTLLLHDPQNFHGEIAGIVGSGNVLDLRGFDAANDTVVASTVGGYDSDANTTSLVVTDETPGHLHSVNLTLVGDYSNSTWTISDDHNGGANIVDPPADSSGGTIVDNPLPPASQTIVASVPNETLTGSGASNTYVFNFAGIGHDTVTDFHPATDVLQFSAEVLPTAQAALNATQDDGHGNTVVTLDAGDAIILSGVLKAQLQASDFHFV